MTHDFKNRVVLITGGTGGLGTTLCKAYLRAGARVYATGREEGESEGSFDEFAEELAGGTVRFERFDIRNVEKLQQWVGQAAAENGGQIDVLVNAAGICPLNDLEEMTEELWDDVMNINLKSAFFACQAAIPHMVTRRSGTIVNIGSTAAYNGGIATAPVYGASKGGLLTLTKWFAARYSQYGIRVNAVAPGPFHTDMISEFPPEMLQKMAESSPDRKLGEPQHVAESILFLSGPSSNHITGATLDVCGGMYMR